MPKRVTIHPPLSVKELKSRYRAAKTPVERSHYQIVWLLAQGKTTEEVAVVTGYCRDWMRKLPATDEVTPQVPRPAHEEADPFEQEAWKKKLAQKVAQVQREHPNSAVELWTIDEQTLVPR